MATIIPFRGVRYNQEKAGRLAELVTPPYDVIDADSQEAFYRRNPYNIIRLEYGKQLESDEANENRYTRAARFFEEWREKGILIKDEKPSIYLYQQEFELGGEWKVRTGFICGVKLEPYEKGVVIPHEETIPKHKADRLELMRACRANFSPIFGLYADEAGQTEEVLQSAASGRTPDVEFKDDAGQLHRMWVLQDEEVIRGLQDCLSGQRILIADGHHRYETALAYREERRKAEGREASTDRPYDYVMMTLVNLFDPGLVILPTHRLVKEVQGGGNFIAALREEYNLEELDPQRYYRRPELVEELLARRSREKHVFVIYEGNRRLYLLEIEPVRDGAPARNRLDVAVLQNQVLEKHLGIGDRERATGTYLHYTRDGAEVFREVDSGRCRLGIFVHPTSINELVQVAGGGEKMPQKSTYFYPKLITGLVINELD